MPTALTLTFKSTDEVFGLLHELSRLCGNPRRALTTLMQFSPYFQMWRTKVALCSHCHRYVPVWRDREPPTLDEHRTENPGDPPPHWIACSGSNQRAELWAGPPAREMMLEAHIQHYLETFQPGLL